MYCFCKVNNCEFSDIALHFDGRTTKSMWHLDNTYISI